MRGIVRGILGETTADFDRVLNTIQGVVKQNGKREGLFIKKEDKHLLGLSRMDKVLLGVLQQNSTLMENFTKSFAQMNLSTNQRGGTITMTMGITSDNGQRMSCMANTRE